MTALIIFFLFFLRYFLLWSSKFTSHKLSSNVVISRYFKIFSFIFLFYLYFLSDFFLENICTFYALEKIIFLRISWLSITFSLILTIYFIFENFVVFIQKILVGRQFYFMLVALIACGFSFFPSHFNYAHFNFLLTELVKNKLSSIPDEFDFVCSVENQFMFGGQIFWFYFFIKFLAFFSDSLISLSEKVFVALIGPFFPGIGYFANDIITSVKELEGIKLIIKKGFNLEGKTANSRLIEIINNVRINPIKTADQLFSNIVLFSNQDKDSMKDVENGELVTFIARISNLVVPDKNEKDLVPTKHFKPFVDHLEIKGNLVKFKSFSYLNSVYKGFQQNSEIIPPIKSEIKKEGFLPFNIHLAQANKNGKFLNLSKEEFTVLDPQLQPFALDDIYNRSSDQPIENLDKAELLLTDGDQRNPMNMHIHYMLKLQLAAALIVKEDLGLDYLQPVLSKGQGEYLTTFNQEIHLVEIKVESEPKNKQEVLNKIEKILQQKMKKILQAEHPFIFSFTFPNFSGELSEEDWFNLKNSEQYVNVKSKISLLTITQFKA